MFLEEKVQPRPQTTERTTPSLAGFIAWLETQKPAREYDFRNCGKCAVAQYFTSLGLKFGGEDYGLHRELITEVLYRSACPKPWTFGAALERARAL